VVKARKASSQDIDSVADFLCHHFNGRLKRNDWCLLFNTEWNDDDRFPGFLLENSSGIVGFVGTLLSRRLIKSRYHRFCNIHSWVVEPEYRNQSIELAAPILKLKDYNFTNFTTVSQNVQFMMKIFGFKVLESASQVLFPFPDYRFRGFNLQIDVVFERDEIAKHLNEHESKIFADHLNENCTHILVRSMSETCYIIAKETILKNIRFAYVYLISNPEFFLKTVDVLRGVIVQKMNTIGLIVENRFVHGEKMRFSVKRKVARYYKPATVAREDIDNLYSELVLLPRIS